MRHVVVCMFILAPFASLSSDVKIRRPITHLKSDASESEVRLAIDSLQDEISKLEKVIIIPPPHIWVNPVQLEGKITRKKKLNLERFFLKIFVIFEILRFFSRSLEFFSRFFFMIFLRYFGFLRLF